MSYKEKTLEELKLEVKRLRENYANDPYWKWENWARAHDSYWKVIYEMEEEILQREQMCSQS